LSLIECDYNLTSPFSSGMLQEVTGGQMKISELRIIALVAPEFEDLEFWVPVMRLREEGASVTIAGAKPGELVRGKGGLSVQTDIGFEKADPASYDAILIPGGWAPDKLRRYSSVKTMVKSMYDQQKIVAMICHAGLVGISAGIVSGHPATGSEGIKDDLINAGAVWRDEPAFRSGNLVWGRVVADIPQFCHELVNALSEWSASRA
jgi:protease I